MPQCLVRQYFLVCPCLLQRRQRNCGVRFVDFLSLSTLLQKLLEAKFDSRCGKFLWPVAKVLGIPLKNVLSTVGHFDMCFLIWKKIKDSSEVASIGLSKVVTIASGTSFNNHKKFSNFEKFLMK